MTRGNVYIMDSFIGELGSDAYPVLEDEPYYPNSFWGLMSRCSKERCTQKQFEVAVKEYIRDEDYLPPKSQGVGNWAYEYMWVPVEQHETYRDWENWRGEVLVRGIAWFSGYYQVPGCWMRLSEFIQKEKLE